MIVERYCCAKTPAMIISYWLIDFIFDNVVTIGVYVRDSYIMFKYFRYDADNAIQLSAIQSLYIQA